MEGARNIMFVGGPGSGKSNYLFRTWLAIERETGKLVKDGLPEDAGYLHDGATILLSGRFAPHTSLDTHHICQVPVARRDAPKSTGLLVVPDASGELWLNMYQKREWPRAWDELVNQTSGFVLFFRANSPHNVPALDWIACERMYGKARVPQATGTPTQVLLVDWLQILRSLLDRNVGRSYVPRLSVVVAAWDCVMRSEHQQIPLEYLDAEAPLLSQFIRSDAHGFDARVFGVSVLGGDPEVDAEFRSELASADPATLGYAMTPSLQGVQRVPDVLEPLYWALRAD